MLTSDDRVWILLVVRVALRTLVDALRGDGAVAVHNFNIEYKSLMGR
jgi:hypothetical protein